MWGAATHTGLCLPTGCVCARCKPSQAKGRAHRHLPSRCLCCSGWAGSGSPLAYGGTSTSHLAGPRFLNAISSRCRSPFHPLPPSASVSRVPDQPLLALPALLPAPAPPHPTHSSSSYHFPLLGSHIVVDAGNGSGGFFADQAGRGSLVMGSLAVGLGHTAHGWSAHCSAHHQHGRPGPNCEQARCQTPACQPAQCT